MAPRAPLGLKGKKGERVVAVMGVQKGQQVRGWRCGEIHVQEAAMWRERYTAGPPRRAGGRGNYPNKLSEWCGQVQEEVTGQHGGPSLKGGLPGRPHSYSKQARCSVFRGSLCFRVIGGQDAKTSECDLPDLQVPVFTVRSLETLSPHQQGPWHPPSLPPTPAPPPHPKITLHLPT